MRVGNGSQATPRRYFCKLSETELKKLATKALLKSRTSTNEFYMSFIVKVRTWYSKGRTENNVFEINGKRAVAIYLDTNDYSTKPGVLAEWIIRIYH